MPIMIHFLLLCTLLVINPSVFFAFFTSVGYRTGDDIGL